jgi:membrane protein DedA with SNARE-associated domain
VAVGTLANLVGSWVAYAVGRAGRVDLLEKHGPKVGISIKHLRMGDHYFERHGDATVFWTRMMPIVRTFVSLPAGVARMPFLRFSVLTTLGCIPWVLMLTFIGQQAGARWERWKDSLHYVDYAVAALIVVGFIYLVVRWRRNRGGPGDEGVGPADDAGPGRSGEPAGGETTAGAAPAITRAVGHDDRPGR